MECHETVSNREFTMNIPGKTDDHRTAWIGLAHVRPRPGNESLGRAVGGFVPVLALAQDQREFVSKVVESLNMCDFDVLEIADIEQCDARFSRQHVAEEIKTLANSLSEECSVVLDTFQAYT